MCIPPVLFLSFPHYLLPSPPSQVLPRNYLSEARSNVTYALSFVSLEPNESWRYRCPPSRRALADLHTLYHSKRPDAGTLGKHGSWHTEISFGLISPALSVSLYQDYPLEQWIRDKWLSWSSLSTRIHFIYSDGLTGLPVARPL